MEKAGLFQLVSIQRKIPGDSVEKIRLLRQYLLQRDSREQCRRRQAAPGCACSEEIAGTGQTGGISSEASA